MKLISIIFLSYFLFIGLYRFYLIYFSLKNKDHINIKCTNFIVKNKYFKILENVFDYLLFFTGILIFIKTEEIKNSFWGLLGFAYFPIMVFFIFPSINYIINFNYKIFEYFISLFKNIKTSAIILLQVTEEELIWRSSLVFFSKYLGFKDIYILIFCSCLFYSIHFKFYEKEKIKNEFELLFFSFFIYAFYLTLNSLVCVTLFHFYRNTYIKFYKKKRGLIYA